MTRPAHPAPTGPRLRVMVVDDSLVFRRFLVRALEADPGIEVVAEAASAEEALARMDRAAPDVITLDLEMPGQGGMHFLKHGLANDGPPVIVISSQTPRGAARTIEALEAGAVDVLAKPRGLEPGSPDRRALDGIATRVRAIAGARIHKRRAAGHDTHPPVIAGQAPVGPVAAAAPAVPIVDEGWIIAIGASTGGVQALGTILPGLPEHCPPVVIVQHMPEGFTDAFATRLNQNCRIEVREAKHGDRLRPGLALIAPGGTQHLKVARDTDGALRAVLAPGEPVCFSRPAVDVLFRSVAETAGRRVSAAVLTGMGSDGAEGLMALRRAGARTFVQDEATSLIHGMPARAWELGAALDQVPIEAMGQRLLASVGTASARGPAGPITEKTEGSQP